jgi:CheY-like chemotaxis protein
MPIEPGSRSVLVCEDDSAMLRIFQFILRQHGISQVVATASGENVLALAVQHHPALILLDMMLPNKDGLTVLKELKGNVPTRDIPVIVVSGKESQLQVKAAMAAGAIDYVIKPFEPAELGARIKSFLDAMRSSTPTLPFQKSPPPSSGIGGIRA